ncbi:NUDIX domain-containing protein [Aquincola sp. S2]|uniref:NUDIX domain-containing protein n=1 Tax=Pseudaquabacterium terrae TaxID=2732868 RepID=A0ABX2EAE2_9BURK|nr:NUDIX domain-containing protein [Aquabacterium terrae]NRF66034.1 NUDIX domain-containing protein [Aquabacterium terrae]
MNEAVRVGIGVIVVRAGRVLLGQRQGSHGAGHWALPGGHLEFGEAIEACAARELAEETGLAAARFARGPYTSDVFGSPPRHYLTLFVLAHAVSGEPVRCEPDKCLGWQWCEWDALPQPVFAPLQSLVDSGWRPPDMS